MITKMRTEHIPAVVQVHKDSFPNNFLTHLGDGVLEVIYTEFSKSGYGYVFVEGDEVAGFWAGTYTPALAFYKKMLFKHPVRLPVLLLAAVLRDASVGRAILARARRMFLPASKRANQNSPYIQIANSKERIAYSLTIAVAPHHRGKGISNQIWVYGIQDLVAENVYAIMGTVISDNASMNAVNEKSGFKKLAVLDRVDGKKEIKWLRYKRDECTVSEDGHVTWL